MGFKSLNKMETIVNVSNVNYGIVGFGLLVATRIAPLMFIGVWGSPSLGLGSTNSLFISFGLLMVVVLALHCEGGNTLGDKGKLRLVSCLHSMFVSWLIRCHTSHPRCVWLRLEVTGEARMGWLKASLSAQG